MFHHRRILPMIVGSLLGGLLLFWSPGAAQAASPQDKAPRMIVVKDKDISGSIHKKLGLPNRQYCWDACLKDDECSGARWGVVENDTAGLCMLLSGPLTFKAPSVLKTGDGKHIRVIVGRKQSAAES